MRLKVKVNAVGTKLFLSRLKSTVDTAPGEIVERATRDHIGEELRRGKPYSRHKWPPLKPFGTRKLPAVPLGGQGSRVYRAWMSAGAERSDNRLRIGFRAPWAAVHRGGPGMGDGRRVTKIKVTPRMRRFVAWKFGVFLKKSTKYIRVPARRHALPSPRLHKVLVQAYKEEIRVAIRKARRR